MTANLELPDLRVVPVEALVPHEQDDPQRTAPLIERLKTEQVLKNPPVVADLGDGRYVVLDGANRCTALAALGLPHALVQVVDYEDPELRLTTWFHLICGCDRRRFLHSLSSIAGLREYASARQAARVALARREIIAYVLLVDGQVIMLHGGTNLFTQNLLLNALVDSYKDHCMIYRVNTDRLQELKDAYEDILAVVVFPKNEPVEIQDLARSGARLPAGITRHIIPRRALRLNFPLSVLSGAESLDEKNVWLSEWLHGKVVRREIRYYEESTVLFDE